MSSILQVLKQNRFIYFTLFLILAVSLVLGGCNQGDNGAAEQPPVEAPASEQPAETGGEADGYPLTFIDGVGEEVTLEAEPQRIISMLPSNTEIAFAIGVGDRLIGRSQWCNFPAEANDLPVMGDMNMDVELVLSAEPDLVLLSPYHFNSQLEQVNMLKQAGIAVVVINDSSTFDDVYSAINLLGKATAAEAQAEQLVTQMQAKLSDIKAQANQVEAAKRVWIELSPAPDIFTNGQNTFMHEMLVAIGAENVAGDLEGWAMLSDEEVVQRQPEIIVITYGSYVENAAADLMARSGWSSVPAVANQEVYDVDGDLLTRPGPRLMDGVERLAQIIYPEIFN